jgi:hypothetical protein
VHIPHNNSAVFAGSETDVLEVVFVCEGGELYFVDEAHVGVQGNHFPLFGDCDFEDHSAGATNDEVQHYSQVFRNQLENTAV